MLAPLVLLAAVTVLPMLPSAAKDAADKAGEITAGQATLADALALLPEGREGVEVLEKAMRYTAHGSDEEFVLAALMTMHAEKDTAREQVTKALQNTAPSQIDNPEEVAALAAVLRYVSGTEQQAALTRYLQQKTLPEGLLDAFGGAMQEGRTLSGLLSLCDEINAAGHDPLAFLKACKDRLPQAEAARLVEQADNAEHRTLLIRAFAPEKLTLDEALAYLRWAKEWGVPAATCYPEGVLLDMDTSKWDPYTSEQATSWGKRDTFLVLRREEKREPITTIMVAEEEKSWINEELQTRYEDYDPDASLGAAQYTVWLDTDALDRMPAERIPQTLADCNALVILDTWYFCDGYVREFRTVQEPDGRWKRRQIDVLCFGVCQVVDVYNAQTGAGLFSAKQNVITSPAMLNEDLSFTDEMGWNAGDNYIATPDEAWMAEARADFLNALERRNWLLVP